MPVTVADNGLGEIEFWNVAASDLFSLMEEECS